MSLADTFRLLFSSSSDDELPNLYPLSVLEKDFISIDLMNIYAKILTDVLERTQGLSDDFQGALWDNCLKSESSDGLVTLLSKAMAAKQDLYLVWTGTPLKVLRKATADEQSKIRLDYEKQAKSNVGTYISFKNYTRTDMLLLYSALEYCTIDGLNKNMNISKAVQFKMNDLRSSVGLTDSSQAKAQALAMAQGLALGKDLVLDAKDIIETAKPDLVSTQTSLAMINEKRSFYLGMPASYITGVAPKGLGDSGEGDSKAVERGLKNYFFSIVRPVLESIFGAKTTFKSEDFRNLNASLEAMKVFELTSDELMSQDNKRIIINKLFGLPEDEMGDEPEEPVVQIQPGQRDVTPPPPPEKKPAAV